MKIDQSTLSVVCIVTLVGGCESETSRDPSVASVEGTTTTTTTGTDTGAVEPGSSSSSGGDGGEPCAALRAEVEQTLAGACYACHAGGQASGGFALADDIEGMLTRGYIVPGAPEGSPLYRKVASGEMPLGGPPLAPSQIATLGEFIAACTRDDGELPGLGEPPGCVNPDTHIPSAAALAAMKADLVSLDLVTAPSVRYIDLTALHNAGYCQKQIEGWRHALAKALNSLSRGTEIVVPRAINAEATIFRIDLRDYEWTPELWALVVAANPYAIAYESSDAQFIRSLTGAEVFVQAGEWFIDATVQPPLYHALLDIPATRQELEARFTIDVVGDVLDEQLFDGGDVVRAGFFDSGVSENNRAFDCHRFTEADNRYYCLSHDFKSNQGEKSDVFRFPLDFVPDGGEVIFTLANGLQGYMIVDAAGGRLDRAPLEVVADVEHGGEVVTNGLSCMGCHTSGARLREDEVRAAVVGSVEFSELVRERVDRLYGKPGADGPSEIEVLLKKLDERFRGALANAGVPERIGGEEPVSAVHLAFERDVTLARAAAEFGITDTELLKQIGGLEGLELLDKKPVDRATFQANFAVNACRLNLGVTPACPTPP